MKIGIDISQVAYKGTGVAILIKNLLLHLLRLDNKNEYVLFFSSLRGSLDPEFRRQLSRYENVHVRIYKFPPLLLDVMWNRLHIVPIEWFIGDIDVFLSSDWTEPPTRKAKKATILYDLIVKKFPEEMDKAIVQTHNAKLKWVKNESQKIICISEATKKDAREILGIEDRKLTVVYPGL